MGIHLIRLTVIETEVADYVAQRSDRRRMQAECPQKANR